MALKFQISALYIRPSTSMKFCKTIYKINNLGCFCSFKMAVVYISLIVKKWIPYNVSIDAVI